MKQRIKELENMSSRTTQQEQELKDKKTELAELENQNTQEPKKTNYLPWIIGGAVLVGIVGIITYLLTRKKDHGEYNQ
ncbi:MAG: hypothetical protein MRERV_14c003 [Mycoplasmataceae bacterium RV_VA103A]|nr:MAG: hypothetical protein MRERV_14c003 [Mycoplasmataceae bacterium RV_VA103A]